MIKTVRTCYCDACGKEITGYRGSLRVMNEMFGETHEDAYDFCDECMKSFNEWITSRVTDKLKEGTNNG